MVGKLQLVSALALAGTLVFSFGCGDTALSFGSAQRDQAQETPTDDPIADDKPVDDGDLAEGGFEPGDEVVPEEEPPPGDAIIACSGAAGDFALLSLGTTASELSIGPSTKIDGNVGAGYWVTKGPHSVVSGDVIFPVNADVLSDASSFVGQAVDIAPHKYQPLLNDGLIDVGNHGWVIGVGNVEIPDGGTLEITGGSEGKLLIRVSGSFHFGFGSELKLSGELTAADVLFFLEGPTPANTENRIEGGSVFDGATILAPERTVLLGSYDSAPNNSLIFSGAVLADTVKVAPSSEIASDPFGKCPF